jgi:hypothetical protein
MSEPRVPHFLRVVRALARVGGTASVAIVIPACVAGCSSGTMPTGFMPPPEDASADGAVTDGAAFDGFITGIRISDAGAFDGQPTGVGGPLSPPELPEAGRSPEPAT